MLNVFNSLIYDINQKMTKTILKRRKLENSHFGVIFGSLESAKKVQNLHNYKSHEAKFM